MNKQKHGEAKKGDAHRLVAILMVVMMLLNVIVTPVSIVYGAGGMQQLPVSTIEDTTDVPPNDRVEGHELLAQEKITTEDNKKEAEASSKQADPSSEKSTEKKSTESATSKQAAEENQSDGGGKAEIAAEKKSTDGGAQSAKVEPEKIITEDKPKKAEENAKQETDKPEGEDTEESDVPTASEVSEGSEASDLAEPPTAVDEPEASDNPTASEVSEGSDLTEPPTAVNEPEASDVPTASEVSESSEASELAESTTAVNEPEASDNPTANQTSDMPEDAVIIDKPSTVPKASQLQAKEDTTIKLTKHWQGGKADVSQFELRLKNNNWQKNITITGQEGSRKWETTIKIPKRYANQGLQIEEVVPEGWQNKQITTTTKSQVVLAKVQQLKPYQPYLLGTADQSRFLSVQPTNWGTYPVKTITNVEQANWWMSVKQSNNDLFRLCCYQEQNYVGHLYFDKFSCQGGSGFPKYSQSWSQQAYYYFVDNTGSIWGYDSNNNRYRIVYNHNQKKILSRLASANPINGDSPAVLYQKTTKEYVNSITVINKKVNPKFIYTKTIDAFRDQQDNPDTMLDNHASDKTDLYRLYLTAKAKIEPKPIDFLFVVDQSGSMDKQDVYFGERKYPRDTAVTKVLNGSENQATKEGLIAKIVKMNPKNQVAVVGFHGDIRCNINNGYYDRSYQYQCDTSMMQDWVNQSVFVNAANYQHTGTNYEAGLYKADEMFNKLKDNDHKKVMVFLSDGVPTYFIINQMDINRKQEIKNSGYYGAYIQDFYQDQLGCRWGNGGYKDQYNYPFCLLPSKWGFDDFNAKHPDVTTYTVGVSKDINGNEDISCANPEVLKYYAQVGGGKFIGITDGKEFMDEMENIIEAEAYTQLVMQDTLSEYVDFYEQPDIKISKQLNGKQTVLFENGQPTVKGKDGRYLVQKVTLNGKNITVTFNPTMEMENEAEYCVSYNIQTTKKAYDEYAEKGYGTSKGDANTDYTSNKTSSHQPGFYSNKEAKVSYHYHTQDFSHRYKHPVIQVNPDQAKNITLKALKKWDDQGHGFERPKEVVFQLMRKDNDGEFEKVEQQEQKLSNENNWQVTWENLPLERPGHTYDYKIKEITQLPLYQVSDVTMDKADKIWQVSLTNTYLPHTSVSVEKTWVDDGISRPTEVQVKLQRKVGDSWLNLSTDIHENQIVNPVTLNADNSWSYRWTTIPEGEYRVVEIDVPNGYEVSVTENSDSQSEIGAVPPPDYDNYNVVPVTADNVFKKTEFYQPGPFGILGGFHLVGFDKITANTHINGNLCTSHFHLGKNASNWGTNGVKEISYAKTITGGKDIQAGGSGAGRDSILVVGQESQIDWLSENDHRWTIDRQVVDRNLGCLWQDTEVKFVDLADEKRHAETISRNLVTYQDTAGITVDKKLGTKQLKLQLLHPDEVNVIHLTTDDLKDIDYMRVVGYPKNQRITVVINLEVLQLGEIYLPELRLVYTDGTMAPIHEVVEWQNANLVWNFHQNQQPYSGKIHTTNGRVITGLLLAPDAVVNLNSSFNGTAIAKEITVNCESHRTDFIGQKLYVDKHWVVTNTKIDQLDYQLPSSGKLGSAACYWIFGSAIVFIALKRKRVKG